MARTSIDRWQRLGFFDLAWTIFRVSMKGIFSIISVVYAFCALVLFINSVNSGDLLRLPPQEIVLAFSSAFLMGLLVVSYVTLFLAVPVSVFCATLALIVTVLSRITDSLSVSQAWMAHDRGTCPQEPPPPDPRIEVVDARIDAGVALCPVCAELIGGDHVSCLKCDSPHHLECWEYIGCCATFGCGGSYHTRSDVSEGEGADWWRWGQSSKSVPKAN